MTSPRTPQDVLRRVIRMSRINGWSVAIFAVVSTLVCLAFGDPIGASVCIFVGLGGVFEVRGQRMLTHRDADGMRWLIRGQWVVLVVICSYAVSRLMSFDAGYLQQEALPSMRQMLSTFGMNLDEVLDAAGLDATSVVPFVRLMVVVLYGSLILVTLIYQGGMVLYYRRRIETVEAALRAPPAIPVRPESGDFVI